MRLHGLLCDLVPFDSTFEKLNHEWLNGPFTAMAGMLDGLGSRAAYERRQEAERSRGPSREIVRFGMSTHDGRRIGLYFVGNINDVNGTAELGAGIGDPAYWGGGYGSDATLLAVDYAFNWLNLRRVYLQTMGNNRRAQRQVEKCGFTLEAIQRHGEHNDGQRYDMYWYGLLRDEWPGYEGMVERLGLHEKAQALGGAAG